MKVSESTNIAMPIKNLISIIAAVAIGVWAYFGITEKLNNHATQLELMSKDLIKLLSFLLSGLGARWEVYQQMQSNFY